MFIFVQVLQDNNFKVSLVETLDFIFHADELKKICQDLTQWDDHFSAIIFTSPRAVQAFQMSGLPGIVYEAVC